MEALLVMAELRVLVALLVTTQPRQALTVTGAPAVMVGLLVAMALLRIQEQRHPETKTIELE
jgi:hypothetical protein